jgi:hypothetical protein
MIGPRELRVRVLERLEREVKQFRTRQDLYPLRIPREPLLLASVIDRALGEDARRFDPAGLRSRTLLDMRWPDGSTWELWVASLPSGLRVFCDRGDDGESRALASGGRNAGDESDRMFLELLAESEGEHFGIEWAGLAPSRVRTTMDDRPFLVDFFVSLFEGTEAEAGIRADWGAPADRADTGRDFRAEVERWLDEALQVER